MSGTAVRGLVARACPVVALVVGATLLVACGVPIDPNDRPLTTDQFRAIATEPTTTGPGVPVCRVHPYWVLGAQIISAQSAVTVTDVNSALRVLLVGPGSTERASGVATALSNRAMLRSATAERGTATVEVGPLFERLAEPELTRAVAQVVFTLTQVPGVGLVSFTKAGAPFPVPLADGTRADGLVSREDYAALLAS